MVGKLLKFADNQDSEVSWIAGISPLTVCIAQGAVWLPHEAFGVDSTRKI